MKCNFVNKIDIKIKEIKYQESINNLENNYLEINFSGKDVNYIILNTIRRTLLRYIPIYAFDSNKITKNRLKNISFARKRYRTFWIYVRKFS